MAAKFVGKYHSLYETVFLDKLIQESDAHFFQNSRITNIRKPSNIFDLHLINETKIMFPIYKTFQGTFLPKPPTEQFSFTSYSY